MMPRFLLSVLIVGLSIGHACAQTVNVVEVDTSSFPIVAGDIELERPDQPEAIHPSEIQLRENGSPCNVIAVDCSGVTRREPVAMVILCDVSESMGVWDPQLALTRRGASRAVARRDFSIDRVALVAFDDSPHRRRDWSGRGDEVLAAIDALRSGAGGTFYTSAMNDAPDGALQVAARGAGRRHVVLFTDGGGSGDPKAITRLARTHGVTIHAVVIGRVAGDVLREVVHASGGIVLDNLVMSDHIDAAIDSISKTIAPDSRCRIRWIGTSDCNALRSVDLLYDRQRGVGSYRAPSHGARRLHLEPPVLDLQPSTENTASLVLSAEGGDVHVERIEADHPDVEVTPTGPFDLRAGDRRALLVSISTRRPSFEVARISILSNACRPVISAVRMAGGAEFSIPTGLRLIQPNGGETLIAGRVQALEWVGGAGRPVRCDISIDSGATWSCVAMNTTRDGCHWPVSMTPSNGCLARVALDTVAATHLLAPWNVGSYQFSADGSLVIGEARYGKMIDLWDVNTGERVMQLEGRSLIGIASRGNEVIVATELSMVQTWSISRGEIVSRRTFPGLGHHGAYAYSTALDRCVTTDWIGADSTLVSVWSLDPFERRESNTVHGLVAAEISPDGKGVIARPLFGGGASYVVGAGSVRTLGTVSSCAPRFEPDDGKRVWCAVPGSTSGARDSTFIVVCSTDDGRALDSIGPFAGAPVALDVCRRGSVVGLVVDRGGSLHLVIAARSGSIVEERVLPAAARSLRLGEGGRRFAVALGDSAVMVGDVIGPMQIDVSDSCWSIDVPGVRVFIHDTTGWAGEPSSISIEPTTSVAGDPPLLDYHFELQIEPAQLLPLTSPSWMVNNMRVVSIDGTLGAPVAPTLAVLPLLGAADTLAVTLKNFVWRDREGNEYPAESVSSPGTFRILGTCDRIGGRRIRDGNAPQLGALCSGDVIEISWSGYESGRGELSIHDVTGELLWRRAVDGPGGSAAVTIDGAPAGIVIVVARIGIVVRTVMCIVRGS